MPLVIFGLLGPGCDGVFGLVHVRPEDPPDAAPPDAECVPVGHDEDGDAIDDACDPCPFDVDNSGDADGDGIALACDPDPGKPNQRIFFSGFDAASRTDLTLASGTYTQDAFVASGPGVHALYWNGNPDGMWIIAGVDVTGLENETYHELGFVFDAAVGPTTEPNGTYCVLGYSTNFAPPDYLEIYRRDRPTSDMLALHSDSTLALGLVHGVIKASYARTAAQTVSCTFATPDMSVVIGATPTAMPPPGNLALLGDATDVTFRFLFIARK